MKFIKRITSVLLSLTLSFGSFAAFASEQTEQTQEIKTGEGFQVWENISDYVSDIYIDETLTKEDIMKMGISYFLEDEEAMVEVLKKTLESLDPYCSFMTAQEYRNYVANMNGIMYGLGVTIEQKDDGVYINGFADGSLAPQAGFLEGDKIITVGGIDMTGMGLEEVRRHIVGELGTKVDITVERNGNRIDLVGTRCAINTATVVGGVLNGNIGYMQILSFGSDTDKEVRSMLDSFSKSQVKKLIIDLRDNVGGLLNSAISISKMLVPKGKIIDVKYRNTENNQSYYSELEKAYYDTIILVNGNTASSSEIFASAMKESGAAKIYGTTTYGKGVIQATFSLNNGAVLKVTTGQYMTRNGNEINGIGIEPDEYIENYKEKIDVSGYTRFNFTDKWCVGQSGTPVKAAKERLEKLGYFTGSIESEVFTPQLQDSLKAYQSVSGLSASGILDIPTQVKLDQTFGTLEKEVDVQLQRAYVAFGGKIEELYN